MSNKQTAKQPEPFSMPIGNKLRPNIESYHPGWRTIKQFETVRKIASRKDFAFSCSTIFLPEEYSHKYKGPFMFSYYDTNHKIHGLWILGNGTYKDY